MPKYLPNTRFTDCWGSAGDVTFYHRNGECFWRKRAVPQFPGTMLQMEHQSVHLRALEAWRGLKHDVQLLWNGYAQDVVTHKPPYDGQSRMTGHNLFVSAYHGFAQLGSERVPEPVPYEDFPVFDVEFSSAEVSDDGGMGLSFVVSLPNCDDPSRYRVVMKLQLARPGYGQRPGLLRNFTALENCSGSESVVKFQVPDYRDVWDLDLTEYQSYCRFFLIDTKTGYRCLYRKFSFVFQLK